MKFKKTILAFYLLLCAGFLQAQPIITHAITQPTCNDNGSVTISVTGGQAPYAYEWKIGGPGGLVFSTSTSLSNVSPGFYWLTVTDANNEFDVDSVYITNGIHGSISTVKNAVCPQQNGEVQANVSGGTAPYSYSWSTGATTQRVTGLAGGTVIQAEIKDANGCYAYTYSNNIPTAPQRIFETTVGKTSAILSNYTTTPEECPLNNGTVSVTASGGVAPYTYIWNTTPVKNTAALSGLTYGSYIVNITDAIGCEQTAYVYVDKNAGALNAYATKTNDYCSKKQGTANLTITGGVAPYTVSWPDGSSALTRTDLEYGFYTVRITDQNLCVFNLQIFIDDLSPVYSYATATETGCDNASGAASVQASGGTAPYTYQWNTGAATAAITALPMAYYSVQVKDANGCKSTAWAFVNIKSSCYAQVSGKIFQDDNGNCVQDFGDYPILNQFPTMRAATPSNYLFDNYSITNTGGTYAMRYVLPDQYTVNYQGDQPARKATCPASGKYNLNITTSGINYLNKDFAMKPESLFEDAALVYSFCNIYTPPRPGFNYSYSIPFKNIGTVLSDGYIEVVYGNLETFVASYPAPDFYDPATKTLRFNYANLMLGEVRNIVLTYNLPPATLLGSTYNHTVTANIGGTDPTPENNQYSYPFVVVGSYDPNDLRVTPEGFITETDKELVYSIRFQNTGTYPAELVVVKDVIDQNLDIHSITDITASHAYKFRVLENRTVEFAFENINLADVKRNEPDSHGYVNFKIRKKANLEIGTEIRNTANIYFDYNDPIITNTTVNTMGIATGITEGSKPTGLVYPNPAKDHTTFRFECGISNLQLLTVTGAEVYNQRVSDQQTIDVTLTLTKGMYIYKATAADGNTYSGKLVIE